MVQRSLLTRTERRIEETALWAGIDVRGPDECWPWMRSRRGRTWETGYGQCGWGRQQRGTHRAVYELTRRRPIPPGREIRHKCDNPPCCNPKHLLIGSHADNMADASERRRMSHGERHPHVKLTAEIVAEIRRRRMNCEARDAIAAEYGISLGAIWSLERGRTWAHVTDPPPGFFPNPNQGNRPFTYRKRRRSVVATDGLPLPSVTSEA